MFERKSTDKQTNTTDDSLGVFRPTKGSAKVVIGNGNANKADILSHAQDVWGDVFEEQDFADAACIAAWRIKEALSES